VFPPRPCPRPHARTRAHTRPYARPRTRTRAHTRTPCGMHFSATSTDSAIYPNTSRADTLSVASKLAVQRVWRALGVSVSTAGIGTAVADSTLHKKSPPNSPKGLLDRQFLAIFLAAR
jgi:hypothetical protein